MRTEGKTMNRIAYGLVTFLLVSLAWIVSSSAAEKPLLMELASSTLNISTFYNGTTLEVTGSVPEDMDVALQVSGPKKEVHLKEKGKVAGFLWMNKTDVSLENTPAVYMVYTPPGAIDKFLSSELGLGYKALSKDITINPESEDKAFIFAEYVKLMEHSGVYAIHEGAVSYGESNGNMKGFSVTLDIPSKMSPGNYQIKALAIKDGAIIDETQENLSMELTGLPAYIAKMAFGQPLLFGIIAVVIAIATGLIIGTIFKGGKGSH